MILHIKESCTLTPWIYARFLSHDVRPHCMILTQIQIEKKQRNLRNYRVLFRDYGSTSARDVFFFQPMCRIQSQSAAPKSIQKFACLGVLVPFSLKTWSRTVRYHVPEFGWIPKRQVVFFTPLEATQKSARPTPMARWLAGWGLGFSRRVAEPTTLWREEEIAPAKMWLGRICIDCGRFGRYLFFCFVYKSCGLW